MIIGFNLNQQGWRSGKSKTDIAGRPLRRKQQPSVSSKASASQWLSCTANPCLSGPCKISASASGVFVFACLVFRNSCVLSFIEMCFRGLIYRLSLGPVTGWAGFLYSLLGWRWGVQMLAVGLGQGTSCLFRCFLPFSIPIPQAFNSADDNWRYKQKPPSFSRSDETALCKAGDNTYCQRMILLKKICYIYLSPLPSCFLFFRGGSHYIAKAGLKLDILLPHPPECWVNKCVWHHIPALSPFWIWKMHVYVNLNI